MLVTIDSGPDGKPETFVLDDGGLDAVGLPEDGSSPDSELVSYGGTSSLLERLTAAWQGWNASGQPELDEYSLIVDHDGRQSVLLGGGTKRWPL